MTRLNTTSNGFSILELLLVIITGSILAFGTVSIYRITDRNNQVDETVRLLNIIKDTIIRTHISVPTYATGSLLEGRVLRAETIRSQNIDGTEIVTSFSSGADSVVIDSTTDTFSITLNDVPQPLCIKLFTAYDINTGGFDRFLYNSTVITNPTPIIANTQCSATTSNNSLTWRFR